MVNIIKDCVDMLSSLREEDPTLADKFIGQHMPQWMGTFKAILENHEHDPEKAMEEYGLKMDVVKVRGDCALACFLTDRRLVHLCPQRSIPKVHWRVSARPYGPIWHDLDELRGRYVMEHVSDSGDGAETFQDSDGNEIGFQNLLLMLFDFISASCNKRAVRHLFVNDGESTPFFEQLLYVSIIYMQITNEQEELWSADANQFVADEEESTFSFNARVAAIDVFTASVPQLSFIR